jgi:hypothetical protein
MAVRTACQTPGTLFHTAISAREVSVTAELPGSLDLSEGEAVLLEANLHNAVELVLAPYFAGGARLALPGRT